MNFYTERDLTTAPQNIWDNLCSEGEIVITNNGKPAAIMINVADGSFEETVKAIKQVKAMVAFNSMRQKASMYGYMDDEEIEAEISDVRTGV